MKEINELGAAFMSGFKVGDKIISMDAQGHVRLSSWILNLAFVKSVKFDRKCPKLGSFMMESTKSCWEVILSLWIFNLILSIWKF